MGSEGLGFRDEPSKQSRLTYQAHAIFFFWLTRLSVLHTINHAQENKVHGILDGTR